jgi:hypothetical protein
LVLAALPNPEDALTFLGALAIIPVKKVRCFRHA